MTRLHRKSVEAMTQSRGLKMTPQRRVIVDYLQSATHHPTADEVLNAVNRKFPMTSRATVYNTLNWLKEAGMVKEVFEGGCVRFDPNIGDHHHFVCRKCGRVEDVECDLISAMKICSLPGRQKVENFEVTLRGLCSDCQKK
ncbi:MAG TPA: Fur family transcriptional regulator [Blastocatellia bacterium]|nr:Fur family transcriptional regulator [Blastocatellia bacterium]